MTDIGDYVSIVGAEEVAGIRQLADKVRGERVIHVNATHFGGGVAEILTRTVPLARSLGLDISWQTIKGDERFFSITKEIHNGLQGKEGKLLTDGDWSAYLNTVKDNFASLDLGGDVVTIHDPQPLPLVSYKGGGKWVWRCHIDTSQPNDSVWKGIAGLVKRYDLTIFSMEKYIPKNLGIGVLVDHPTIDPLAPKNVKMTPGEVQGILEKYGVDPERPIIGQVGRFDPWKDPLGVIRTYRLIREKIPSVQLLIIGSFAKDDPEAAEWYGKTVDFAGGDRGIFILSNREGVGDMEVNAFQRAMGVALQLSIREGFGLTVTEALWKGVPVVAKRAGGITLQVIDGSTGFLVDSYEEAALKTTMLLKRAWLARELGDRGEDHVRMNFLITKAMRNYLRMHIELVGKKT
jgi:trehalose synthase